MSHQETIQEGVDLIKQAYYSGANLVFEIVEHILKQENASEIFMLDSKSARTLSHRFSMYFKNVAKAIIDKKWDDLEKELKSIS